MNKSLKITTLENENSSLKLKIEGLKTDLSLEKDKYGELEIESKNNYKALQDNHSIERGLLNSQIDDKEKLLEEKQIQLDRREVKKLAEAYGEQEISYKKDSLFWAKWILGIGVFLVISSFISMCFGFSKPWYERFEYYIVDLILLSALWFCSSQYSDFVKLRNDYANRKTIAQSFNNVLNNLQEDQEIKNKFIEKTTDILCAPVAVSSKEPVLSKEVIKQVAELIKTVK